MYIKDLKTYILFDKIQQQLFLFKKDNKELLYINNDSLLSFLSKNLDVIISKIRTLEQSLLPVNKKILQSLPFKIDDSFLQQQIETKIREVEKLEGEGGRFKNMLDFTQRLSDEKLATLLLSPSGKRVIIGLAEEVEVVNNPHLALGLKGDKLNIYKPSEIEIKIKQMQKPLCGHFTTLSNLEKLTHINLLLNQLTNNNKRTLQYFINWLAFVVQEKRKSGQAIVMKGVQGVGKNFFVDVVLRPYFGTYLTQIDNTFFQEKYNLKIKDAIVVVGDEISLYKERSTIFNRMKAYITNEILEIKGKYLHSFDYLTRWNFLIFSNARNPISLDPSDRRYTIIETSNLPLIHAVKRKLKMSLEQFKEGVGEELLDFFYFLTYYKVDFDMLRLPLKNKDREEVLFETTNKIEYLIYLLKVMSFEQAKKFLKDLAENIPTDVEAVILNDFNLTHPDKTLNDFISTFIKKYKKGENISFNLASLMIKIIRPDLSATEVRKRAKGLGVVKRQEKSIQIIPFHAN